MRSVYLSIGSNINPAEYIPLCIEELKNNFKVKHISSTYETPPVGPAGDDNFWNFAAEIVTDLETAQLQDKLRSIEKKLGRKRSSNNKFLARTMDIDILPQPGFQEMSFIMIPLAEIAPHNLDPETNSTYLELAEKLKTEAKAFVKVRLPESFLE